MCLVAVLCHGFSALQATQPGCRCFGFFIRGFYGVIIHMGDLGLMRNLLLCLGAVEGPGDSVGWESTCHIAHQLKPENHQHQARFRTALKYLLIGKYVLIAVLRRDAFLNQDLNCQKLVTEELLVSILAWGGWS